MPLYDYRCGKCGVVFEQRHSMFYQGPVTCQECGSDDTDKIMSSPASVLDWRDSDSVHESTRFRPRVPNKQVLQGG
jgi:putative FmdB family regulatory protein